MTKKQYYEYKEKGKCVRGCGRDAREGKAMCQECADKVSKYKRENREWAKKFNLCPRCLKNRLMGEEKICPECLAYAAEVNGRSRKKHYGSDHNYYVMDIARLKERGICRGCRTKKVAEGHTYCITCLIKKRERSKNERLKQTGFGISRSEYFSYGLCYRCGDKLDNEDKRLCSKCSKNVIKNFKGIRGTNSYWRNSNSQLTLGGVLRG